MRDGSRHTPLGYRDPQEVLDRVAEEAVLHGDTEASFALAAVMRVVRRHVSGDELEDVTATLPEALRRLVVD
jgi:uncharacterized protein (DUF2267 family)